MSNSSINGHCRVSFILLYVAIAAPLLWKQSTNRNMYYISFWLALLAGLPDWAVFPAQSGGKYARLGGETLTESGNPANNVKLTPECCYLVFVYFKVKAFTSTAPFTDTMLMV